MLRFYTTLLDEKFQPCFDLFWRIGVLKLTGTKRMFWQMGRDPVEVHIPAPWCIMVFRTPDVMQVGADDARGKSLQPFLVRIKT